MDFPAINLMNEMKEEFSINMSGKDSYETTYHLQGIFKLLTFWLSSKIYQFRNYSKWSIRLNIFSFDCFTLWQWDAEISVPTLTLHSELSSGN